MGCVASNSSGVSPASGTISQQQRVPKWRRVLSSEEARRKYEADGTLPPNSPSGLLELRGFLDDPMLMKHVGMFGKTKKSFDAFMCWVDIQEFKSIGSGAEDYRRSKASHIFQKYLKDGALLRMSNVEVEYIDSIESVLNDAKQDKMDLSFNLFDKLQQQCLHGIYNDIFLPFKYSTIYSKIMKSMQHHYNRITPDDFEYIAVLGQGGFGLVVHCKKKSTGKHYALKMQTKMGLLKCYKNVLHRVDFEKQALAACNHPFIVTLDYAFQTNTLVFLAMQLGTGGTLHEALSMCPYKRMSEDRVRFYTAEIVLALGHIHGLGMIYRDLKPPNILLNSDGHIQLVDLGGIIDPGGRVLGLHDESEYMLNGLFVKDYAHFTAEYHQADHLNGKGRKLTAAERGDDGDGEGGDEEAVNLIAPVFEQENNKPTVSVSKRAKSIMGTDGYMAIEMMMLKIQRHEDRRGYTNAVDWWSLGVTMFVLLTGLKPFPQLNTNSVALLAKLINTDPAYKMGTRTLMENDPEMNSIPMEYMYIHDKIAALNTVAPDTTNIILQLLDFNEQTRLGSRTAGGIKTLKEHPFFKWEFTPVLNDDKANKAAGRLTGFQMMSVRGKASQGENENTSNAVSSPGELEAENLPAADKVDKDVKKDSDKVSDLPATTQAVHVERTLEYCWELVEQKQIVPPFMPAEAELNEIPAYSTFDEMMMGIDKVSWLKQYPSTYYDEYFQNWNFISPHILKMEYGIATVMEQYESKYKARQLLGPISEESFALSNLNPSMSVLPGHADPASMKRK